MTLTRSIKRRLDMEFQMAKEVDFPYLVDDSYELRATGRLNGKGTIHLYQRIGIQPVPTDQCSAKGGHHAEEMVVQLHKHLGGDTTGPDVQQMQRIYESSTLIVSPLRRMQTRTVS